MTKIGPNPLTSAVSHSLTRQLLITPESHCEKGQVIVAVSCLRRSGGDQGQGGAMAMNRVPPLIHWWVRFGTPTTEDGEIKDENWSFPDLLEDLFSPQEKYICFVGRWITWAGFLGYCWRTCLETIKSHLVPSNFPLWLSSPSKHSVKGREFRSK